MKRYAGRSHRGSLALLQTGDRHAAQGDGEMDQTATGTDEDLAEATSIAI